MMKKRMLRTLCTVMTAMIALCAVAVSEQEITVPAETRTVTFKCPKKMRKDYEAWLKKPGGAPKTAKFK